MPRLYGFRTRMQQDIHSHIVNLTHQNWWRVFPPDDQTRVVLDVRASTPDVTISFDVGGKGGLLTVTGPKLIGDGTDGTILDILHIASDAVAEGKQMSALEIVGQALKRKAALSVMRPVVVPVRVEWTMRVALNDGATPQDVDIWLTTMLTRDVA